MKSYIEKETILKRIEDHLPVINIEEDDLNKFDEKSTYLFFSNSRSLSLENFLSTTLEEIKNGDFRKIKNVIILIFISKDIGARLKVHEFQNLISGLPEEVDISYGIYFIPKIKNKFEIFFIGN